MINKNKKIKLRNNSRKKVKIAILRNYTIEPILSIIKKQLIFKHLKVEFFISGYDDYATQVLNIKSKFNKFKPDIVMMFFWLHGFNPSIDYSFGSKEIEKRGRINKNIINEIRAVINNCRQKFLGPILLGNFPKTYPSKMGLMDFSLDEGTSNTYSFLNNSITSICIENKSVYLFDLEAKAYFLGYENFLQP